MDVINQIRQGDIRATARLMRDLDEGEPQAREVLKGLYRYTGRAHIVGVGLDEVVIAGAAPTTLVVTVPGMGMISRPLRPASWRSATSLSSTKPTGRGSTAPTRT